jgi:transketolase
LDRLTIDTLRTLSMDAVEAAGSGHPGTAMALAPAAFILWQRFLHFDPDVPAWPNRDRFVLSAGHASALLYSVLHLAGVRDPARPGATAVSIDDLRAFRQFGSRCPGHPEFRHTPGVEMTTGPLGQGLSASVGMAVASRWLGAEFNRPGYAMFDFDTYAVAGDGCLMEGVTAEAASLAGHLKLDNLCWIYDSNGITLDGTAALSFSEDVSGRFRALGWKTAHVEDVNDTNSLLRALSTFRHRDGRPTLVVVRSRIGYGSPSKQGTAAAHGAPLGTDEVRATKRAYGWPTDVPFHVPAGVRDHFRAALLHRGSELRHAWELRRAQYRVEYPELAARLDQFLAGELPNDWATHLPEFPSGRPLAGREASREALNAVAGQVPWLLGGTADLASSTLAYITEGGHHSGTTPGGRNIYFGVREHAMGAVANGLALCGLRPFASTFLVFSDYLKPALRLAALMRLPVIHIFTHDSIAVGEDGPTHQPVEHLAGLRAVPGVSVFRPADANEMAVVWRCAMESKDSPTLIVASRQRLPTLDRTRHGAASGTARGGYVLADHETEDTPDLILIGTGSEVFLCLAAREELQAEGIITRVVSMPNCGLFDRQCREYRNAVLPPHVEARLAVEAASPLGWDRYVGPHGLVLGVPRFGTSGSAQIVTEQFGLTAETVAALGRSLVDKTKLSRTPPPHSRQEVLQVRLAST